MKESLWKQFGASIDMLENAIVLCPDEYWNKNKKLFYITYHSLFFLDYYLTNPPQHFSSPLPFTFVAPGNIPEDAIDDIMPNRMYSKEELLHYLQYCRNKCHQTIAGLTAENITSRWIEEPGVPGTRDYAVVEMLLYNMRHVQHHTAQLNMLLRQGTNDAPHWISRTKEEL